MGRVQRGAKCQDLQGANCSDVMDAPPSAVSFILRLTAFNLAEHHMNTIKVVGIDIAKEGANKWVVPSPSTPCHI